MFNQMSSEFKRQHRTQIDTILETYSSVCLTKDDLIGYAKNQYSAKPEMIQKIIDRIESLDDHEMCYIANKLVTDPMMDSFWLGVENRLDLIAKEIGSQSEQS
ncbi:hypothetical protein FACS189487_10400 [Campylobacterota bacterium]|nr:hypothetical protein FACS189487_10400 [Campylobacterota bacterium]